MVIEVEINTKLNRILYIYSSLKELKQSLSSAKCYMSVIFTPFPKYSLAFIHCRNLHFCLLQPRGFTFADYGPPCNLSEPKKGLLLAV